MIKIDIGALSAPRPSLTPHVLAALQQDIVSVGCFLLTGCFAAPFIEDVHHSLASLFSRPAEEKAKYMVDKHRDPLGPGFSPYGIARALDTGIPNLLETWDLSPTMNNWPSDMKNESQLLLAYERMLYELAHKSLQLFSSCLDVDSDELINLVHPSNGGIHLIHYFPVTEQMQKDARRQSEHCDNTLITLIPPPHPISSGLTVFNRSANTWQDVVIHKTDCLVQAGLLLERITYRTVRANLHTVRNPSLGSDSNVSRYSTPFFLSPDKNLILKVLPKYRSQAALTEFPDAKVSQLQRDYFAKIFW